MTAPSKRALLAILVLAGMATSPALADEPASQDVSIQTLLSEIRLRQAKLDTRERLLAERERAQIELEQLVEAQIEEVAEQRRIMERRMQAWESTRGERIRQLAKIYAAMKPVKAARLLEGLEANLATQVLRNMKHKESAAILEKIESGRALAVSRKVAHPLSFEPASLPEGDS